MPGSDSFISALPFVSLSIFSVSPSALCLDYTALRSCPCQERRAEGGLPPAAVVMEEQRPPPAAPCLVRPLSRSSPKFVGLLLRALCWECQEGSCREGLRRHTAREQRKGMEGGKEPRAAGGGKGDKSMAAERMRYSVAAQLDLENWCRNPCLRLP